MFAIFVFLLCVSFSYSINKGPFLIDTPTCRIPDINPFERGAMRMFSGHGKQHCKQVPDMVRLEKDNTTLQYSLHIDRKVAQELNIADPLCSMNIITRQPNVDDFLISQSLDFTDTLDIPFTTEFLNVSCIDQQSPTQYSIYSDVHFLVQPKESVKKRFAKFSQLNGTRAPSVFIIGLDSTGRINFRRAMPKAVKFLKENNFYDFKGFNKIGDNTYPNLMAMLAGLDVHNTNCDPKIVGGLDKCSFVWKDFKKFGYATAYSEDFQEVSTFNYLKQGFKDPPVDYYGKTGTNALRENGICAGDRQIVEYVYSHGVDFAEFYKGHPYFGLFWTNTLSHNYLHDLLTLEDELLDVLKKSKERGILKDAIVIVMGDHGFRFSPSVNTPSGWYDVRLPILYISLPTWFKDKYPEVAAAMKVNQERLTSPYDLHLTLKDILRRSGRLPKGKDTAVACPTCQSLFKEIPRNRTCDQCGINGRWCTCQHFTKVTIKELREEASKFVVAKINKRVKQLLTSQDLPLDTCRPLRLKQINSVTITSSSVIQVNINTKPGNARYEVQLFYNRKKKTFRMVGEIARENMYNVHSFCVKDVELKQICECSKKHREAKD